MLSSKARILWIRWHGYLACFFLPLALLYTLTGSLYLLGVEGGIRHTQSLMLDQTIDWPSHPTEANKIATTHLESLNASSLPSNKYRDDTLYSWWDFRREISLTQNNQGLELRYDEYDLWRQCLLIHKGLAGPLFTTLGILFGASLLFSLISGAVITLAIPKMRALSLKLIGSGLALLLGLLIFA